MFDLSMAEIGVIGVVALLVLGPERLPKAARTVGFYVRKARQSWYSVRSEFERELAAEELKRSLKLDEVHATLQATAQDLQHDLNAAASTLDAARQEASVAPTLTTGADPLPTQVRLSADSDTSAVEAGLAEGLSPEELARQSEPMPAPELHAIDASGARAADLPPEGSDAAQPHETGVTRIDDTSGRPQGPVGTA
jgi:sec-independent protein translocase protein TatB